MKAVVISMPKAGTYLAANLLQSLGMDFSHIHIDPGMHRIFKNNDLKNFDSFKGDLSMAVSKLKENQFAVGHIPFNKVNEQYLSDYKKILVVRDEKAIQESAQRYKKEKGPDVSSIINSNNLKNIKQWSSLKDVFVINFKEMIDEDIIKINNLQLYLFGNVNTNSYLAISQAKQMDSLTKSSVR